MPLSRLTLASFAALVGQVGLVAVLGPMLDAPSAHAAEAPPQDPTARAEWYSAKAEKAFQDGQFNEAIKLYLDAWEAAPSASILYNVAFIYDKRLKDAELAIDYYDRVAKAADADPALAEKARTRAKALRDAAKPPDHPPDRPPDHPPDRPPDHPPDHPPEQVDDGGGFPVGPVVTMAAGAVVLGTGIVFGSMAKSTHDDFEAAETAAKKKDLQSTGRSQALIADLGMAVGGAALAGGIVWLIIDQVSGPSDASGVEAVPDSGWLLGPTLVPGGAGIAVGGRW